MFRKLLNFIRDARDRQRICIALSRGAAMMHARNIDLTNPATWEFSGFSQNGEDGILDVLRAQLSMSNRYFIEIGAANGIDNNSAWLAIAEKYSGLMIEGDPKLADRANRMVAEHNIFVECLHLFATRESAGNLKSLALLNDPDVMSLDIDGNDYYIAKAVLEAGFRPKIFVVEYNSVFGPEKSVTIEYQEDFIYTEAHPTQLYYGVSITGWKTLFKSNGYKFITVDRNGVNAFFVDPDFFDTTFLESVKGRTFAENLYQLRKFRILSEAQYALIADQKYLLIVE